MELGNSYSTQRFKRFYGDQNMMKFTKAALVGTAILGAAPAFAAATTGRLEKPLANGMVS